MSKMLLYQHVTVQLFRYVVKVVDGTNDVQVEWHYVIL